MDIAEVAVKAALSKSCKNMTQEGVKEAVKQMDYMVSTGNTTEENVSVAGRILNQLT